jgi:hypothetical protein
MLRARGHFAPQRLEEVFEGYRFVLLLGHFGLLRDPVRGSTFSASSPFVAGFDAADSIPDASVPLLLLNQR